MAKLDDSFVYDKDFESTYQTFEKQDHRALFEDLYTSGRLIDSQSEQSKNLVQLLDQYNQHIDLLQEIIQENITLQHQVHQLGIKNRIRKYLKKYRPLASVRTYISKSDLNDMKSGSFLLKNHLPAIDVNQSTLDEFKKKNGLPFEQGLNRLQELSAKPDIKKQPMVSIIIPTRDGLEHLKRLFENFTDTIQYKNYEIIVVDNASTDGTVEYLKQLGQKLPLRVIKNKENKSFSESNNIAAAKATGEYLLFLNNDVVPTYGWLNHMMMTALSSRDIGAVGAKLIYPHKKGFDNSYKVQHGGIIFRLEEGFLRPVNQNMGSDFLAVNTVREENKAAVTAACLLVKKTKFDAINGFDQSYWYGYEDVDLCLKLGESGYQNIINNAAVLYHYEFGTQEKNDSSYISSYRKKNMEHFKNKWLTKLYPRYWNDILTKSRFVADKDLHVCFATTEAYEGTAAGDYFTAKELGSALEEKGIRVSYVGMESSADPYNISPDVDILISMLDRYDISKVTNHHAIKIAWCRNWFERWASHAYIRDFDIVLVNSEKAQEYFSSELFIETHLFKIATNRKRFTQTYETSELTPYKSDICLTSNYWHSPRDITSYFDPKKFADEGRNVKIYGKSWDEVKKFAPYHKGFVAYEHIPKVYKAGKILIDDATWIVNEWGSVNSRVFDGAASGVLVLTNGIVGNENTFDGLLPTFKSEGELVELLQKYLSSDDLRQKKIEEIKQYVLKHHTYEKRADELISILEKHLTRPSINIKMPVPHWGEAKNWGDTHFALALKAALDKLGYQTKLHILKEWDKGEYATANLVLRGLSIFDCTPHQLNLMWNISHPQNIPFDEYAKYDHVFVASNECAKELANKGLKHSTPLLQCFDKKLFSTAREKHFKKDTYSSDILFVGNTRNVFRPAVKFLMQWDKKDTYNIQIYGKGWEKFIDQKFIAGEHIPYNEVSHYYANAKILINDHWDDMSSHGFVSNRLFDASGCGAFVISDKNVGIAKIFGKNTIPEFDDAQSLYKLLDMYIDSDTKRQKKSNAAHVVATTKGHTFDDRAEAVHKIISKILA